MSAYYITKGEFKMKDSTFTSQLVYLVGEQRRLGLAFFASSTEANNREAKAATSAVLGLILSTYPNNTAIDENTLNRLITDPREQQHFVSTLEMFNKGMAAKGPDSALHLYTTKLYTDATNCFARKEPQVPIAVAVPPPPPPVATAATWTERVQTKPADKSASLCAIL